MSPQIRCVALLTQKYIYSVWDLFGSVHLLENMLTFSCVLETQGVKMLLMELWPFHTGQNNCFSPLDRHTSTMMTHSTSTMLRLKQRLATTRKQKRCGALPEKPTFLKKKLYWVFWAAGLFDDCDFFLFSVFSADSEWKVQEWLCLSQLAGTMLYVSKSSHKISSHI